MIPKQDSIFISSDLNGMLKKMQTVLVDYIGVWDLVQETLKEI